MMKTLLFALMVVALLGFRADAQAPGAQEAAGVMKNAMDQSSNAGGKMADMASGHMPGGPGGPPMPPMPSPGGSGKR